MGPGVDEAQSVDASRFDAGRQRAMRDVGQ